MNIYMAIPGSDYDKIEWIKADGIEEAGKVLSDILGLDDEELGECDYRIFEVPSNRDFRKDNCISRASTNFGEYKSYWN